MTGIYFLSIIYFLFLINCFCSARTASKPDYLHQAPEAHKLYEGWQAPGFCRPTWILDRTIKDENGGISKEDRIYLKMKMDNSVEIVRRNRRPFFDWRSKLQRKASAVESSVSDKKKLLAEAQLETDGTWSFKDAYLKSPARFKLEFRDDQDSPLYKYSCNIEFGKVDGYAVKFQEGTIYRYRGINKANGLPINPEEAGSFILRANSNRPIVNKEFQAIQN